MKLLILGLTILFAKPIFAINVKLNTHLNFSGSSSESVKLIDLLDTHKIDQGLIPIFEAIGIYEIKFGELKTYQTSELVGLLRKIKSDYPELSHVKFTLPQKIDIQHHGHKISSKILIEIFKRKWSKKCSSCRFVVKSLTLPELDREYEKQDWYIETSDSVPRGRFSSQIIFPKTKSAKTVWITGQAMTQKPVLVVNRNVARGEIIKPHWTQLAFKNIGDVVGAIVDMSVLRKKVSSKYLMNGDIIKNKYMASKQMFSRGDSVKLIFKDSNISVTTTGIAESSGKIGQNVWVRSANSRKKVSGKVLATGEVLIQ